MVERSVAEWRIRVVRRVSGCQLCRTHLEHRKNKTTNRTINNFIAPGLFGSTDVLFPHRKIRSSCTIFIMRSPWTAWRPRTRCPVTRTRSTHRQKSHKCLTPFHTARCVTVIFLSYNVSDVSDKNGSNTLGEMYNTHTNIYRHTYTQYWHKYAYTHIHKYTHTHTNLYTQTQVHTFTHKCTSTYIYTHVYTYTNAWIHTWQETGTQNTQKYTYTQIKSNCIRHIYIVNHSTTGSEML